MSIRKNLLSGLAFLTAAFMSLGCGVSAPAQPDPRLQTHANVPDVALVNQDGKTVHLYTDLVKGRVAALSFIFTTCPTMCPAIGANLARLQTELGKSLGTDVTLISVSINPETDTPERLNAWAAQFGARPGWSLLTGDPETVTQLLKDLKSFTPDIQSHSPFLLLISDRTGEWRRVNALETPPAKVAELLSRMARTADASTATSKAEAVAARNSTVPPAQKYFTDVQLINQGGKPLRLYTDILKGNVVIINSFFSACNGVCKVTMPVFKALQENFGERVGKGVRLVSITVDPENDTPEVLKKYAADVQAKPGWEFLTGDKATVDEVLYKFGLYADARESHSNVFIIGNEPTGLWKKVLGVAPPSEIVQAVANVVEDRP